MEKSLEPRVRDLAFPISPRWHDGRLWFSDLHGGAVSRADAEGTVDTVTEVPGGPGGSGWLPDGRLLVLGTRERALYRLDPDGLVLHADLSTAGVGPANDMVVDAFGRAYVSNLGFDPDDGDGEKPTTLLLVEPSGAVHEVADGLQMPNGLVITPDGSTLIAAESFGRRLLAFDIEPDGWLGDGRVWADLAPNVPGGICLDEQMGMWVADPVFRQVFRVLEGGQVTHGYETDDLAPYACTLGGAVRQVLYVCLAATSDPERAVAERTGTIAAVSVDVPGAGRP